jgi:hypothetical protein
MGLDPGMSFPLRVLPSPSSGISTRSIAVIKLLGFKDKSELAFEDNVKHSFFIYPDEMVCSCSLQFHPRMSQTLTDICLHRLVGILRQQTHIQRPPQINDIKKENRDSVIAHSTQLVACLLRYATAGA